MATSGKLDFSDILKTFQIDDLQDFQKDALGYLIDGDDVYLSVKTGSGKSLCYHAFQPLYRQVYGEPCAVLIISPLISIMREQCEVLVNRGFTASYVGKSESDDDAILSGAVEFVFASPEQLGTSKWRDMLATSTLIKLFVVDEAHTIVHWGESDTEEAPFRAWFGKLGEARSLLNCPVLLITATASKASRQKIKKKFCMKNCREIIDSPDRPNIKLFSARFKASLPLELIFYFILDELRENGSKCKKYVIFCPSIKGCSDIYTMFRLELGPAYMKHVQMYHSSTTDSVKEDIKKDMNSCDGVIRVLTATSAAGMGVNFQSVYNVIHYGPPKDLDSYVQQLGRAGRDGKQSMALLLFNGKQCKVLDSDMREYIQNSSVCRRKLILQYYNSEPKQDLPKHSCCDICSSACCCDECSIFQHPYFKAKPVFSSSDSDASDVHFDSDSDSN